MLFGGCLGLNTPFSDQLSIFVSLLGYKIKFRCDGGSRSSD